MIPHLEKHQGDIIRNGVVVAEGVTIHLVVTPFRVDQWIGKGSCREFLPGRVGEWEGRFEYAVEGNDHEHELDSLFCGEYQMKVPAYQPAEILIRLARCDRKIMLVDFVGTGELTAAKIKPEAT